MRDGVQRPARAVVAEHASRDGLPVQLAVRQEHLRTELLHDAGEARRPRRHHVARQLVGIQDR
jgi:hypothetical protein